MRQVAVFALSVAVLVSALCSSAAAGSNFPKDPRAVLDAAEPFYNFSSPQLKPWHLKATYQLYDAKGTPEAQGTWEYWWASPKVRRGSWTRGGSERTDWWTAQGALYRKENGAPLGYFERSIESLLLSPLPPVAELDSGRLKLELKMRHKPEVACVSATFLPHGKQKIADPAPQSDYYFDPPTMALRGVYSDYLAKSYSRLVETQGHYLARQLDVTFGKQTLFSVSVDTIESFNPTDAVFNPPSDATLVKQPTMQQTDPRVTKGELVEKAPPVYPLEAKSLGEQGVVVLAAVIGTDGRFHDLEVLASSWPALSQSALDAIKKWEYKPYLLDGQPVEVETTIHMIYSLGR